MEWKNYVEGSNTALPPQCIDFQILKGSTSKISTIRGIREKNELTFRQGDFDGKIAESIERTRWSAQTTDSDVATECKHETRERRNWKKKIVVPLLDNADLLYVFGVFGKPVRALLHGGRFAGCRRVLERLQQLAFVHCTK